MRRLPERYGDRVTVQTLNAKTAESRQAVAELGFTTHGLVIRSSDGTLLWKQADYLVTVPDMRDALDGLLRIKRR